VERRRSPGRGSRGLADRRVRGAGDRDDDDDVRGACGLRSGSGLVGVVSFERGGQGGSNDTG
jgi:hypothetical protein